VKAIFWDNDGVLVDTEHLYFAATRDALSELGYELTESEFVEHSLRRGRSCFDLAAARGVDPARLDAAKLARNDRYAESLASTELIAGVHDTLARLHGSLPMAVVTSSRRHHFELQHRGTGALRFFEFVLAKGDYTRSKPDPEPYLVAATRLGVAPEECLVIEDSERGCVAAARAGMRCAVVPRGLTASGDFARAFRVLERVDQVPDLVAELIASSARRIS
jgi:HAD superfamily hydrolase (TIGR01509 family)